MNRLQKSTSTTGASTGGNVFPTSSSNGNLRSPTAHNSSSSSHQHGISNFFSNLTNFHHSQMSSNVDPPSTNKSNSNGAEAGYGTSEYHHTKEEMNENAVTGSRECVPANDGSTIVRYHIKYIGSTALRRRHTLPMLNWIVTDLLYQSKCDGDELHVKIRNCLRTNEQSGGGNNANANHPPPQDQEEELQRLRAQLTRETHHHGLPVQFEMVRRASPCNSGGYEIAFQVLNKADRQLLLCHSFRRIFLFGKFSRESSLFFYLHKDRPDDHNAVPTIYVFQAKDENQLSEICVKYNEIRPKLQIANDRHIFLNSYIGKTGLNSNCFEVLHVGSVSVSQKRATPAMIDSAAEQFATHLGQENKEENPSFGPSEEETKINWGIENETSTVTNATDTMMVDDDRARQTSNAMSKLSTSRVATAPIACSTGRRQYRTKRFLVQVIEENEQVDSGDSQGNTPTTTPTPTPPNTSSVDSGLEESGSVTVSPCASAVPGAGTTTNSSPSASYLTGSPTTSLISNTQSLDFDSRLCLSKELNKVRQTGEHKDENKNETKVVKSGKQIHVKDVRFAPPNAEQTVNEKDKYSQDQLQVKSSGLSALKRSSSGETTLQKDSSIILRKLQMESLMKANSHFRQNQTMLFFIGQMDICLISTENHKTVFSKTFSNISHCAQGVKHADHFGIIVREPFVVANYTDTNYVAHIFKCQTEPVVNELLCALKQAFNNAYRASKQRYQSSDVQQQKKYQKQTQMAQSELANNSSSGNSTMSVILNEGATGSGPGATPYCGNCPMNWFHQLCLDIYGLDDDTIYALLMFRIQQNSSEQKRNAFYTQILDKLCVTKISEKVDILIILLKARVERMQKRHEIDGCRLNSMTIYDQIDGNDDDSGTDNIRSTQSLTRLEGLKMMAKSSLTNTFESLLKINRNFQSSENLQKCTPNAFNDSTNNRFGGASGSARGSNCSIDQNYSKMDTFCRRNTLAEWPSNTAISMDNIVQKSPPGSASTGLTPSSSGTMFPFPSNNESINKRNDPSTAKNSLLNIFIKVSGKSNNSNTSEELSQSLTQLAMEDCDDDDKNGTFYPANTNQRTNNNSKESGSGSTLESNMTKTSGGSFLDRQLSLNAQIRHKLFKRIRRSMQDYGRYDRHLVNVRGKNQNDQPKMIAMEVLNSGKSLKHDKSDKKGMPPSVETIAELKKKKARDLWKFAIKQQIMLNKMNKQNIKNEEYQIVVSENRARYEYGDIPRIESDRQLDKLYSMWDKLIKQYDQLINGMSPEKCTKTSIAAMEQEIQDAIRVGVPRHFRGEVWRFLAAYRRQGHKNRTEQTSTTKNRSYRNLLSQLAVQQHAIFVDLGRTFPNVPFFAESMGPGQLSLFNVLKAYSLYDKEVEYCQGLSFVAGVLLIHMNEDEAFDLMCYVLYDCGLREQYKPDMEALQMQMYQLSRLLYDYNRPLHDHLHRHDVLPTLYAAPCFLTIFASQFPIDFVARVFDFLIFYGIEAIFRVLYILLERCSTQLVQCCHDFESIMEVLKQNLLSVQDTTEHLRHLFEVDIFQHNFSKELEQYRVEYNILQEEFVHLSSIQARTTTDRTQFEHSASLGSVSSESSPPPTRTELTNNVDSTMNTSAKFNELSEENRQLKEQNARLMKRIQELEQRLFEQM